MLWGIWGGLDTLLKPAILGKQSRNRMVTDCFSFYLFFSSEHDTVGGTAGDISLTIEPTTKTTKNSCDESRGGRGKTIK